MANARRPLIIHGSYTDPDHPGLVIAGKVVASVTALRQARNPWYLLWVETRGFQWDLRREVLRQFGRFDVARVQWKVTRGG